MNLSLAAKIESCSIFSQKGVYTLNQAFIGNKLFQDIIIETLEPALKIKDIIYKDTTDIVYNLDGIVKYKENHENKEIKFILCIDSINNINPSKVEIIYLTDFDKENEKLPITITNSFITNDEVKPIESDEHAMEPDTATKILYEGSSQKLLGQKRPIDDEETQSYNNHKTLTSSDIFGCGELKPGRYYLSDKDKFYIQIISSKFSSSLDGYKVEGFLIYDNFFSVPIIKCDSTEKDLIFSLVIRAKQRVMVSSSLYLMWSINYTVPKNKFIDENYTNTELSPSLNYYSNHVYIGCSILYQGFLNKQSIFRLKNNIQIHISSTNSLSKNLSMVRIFKLKGKIIIEGKEYLIHNCYSIYDKDKGLDNNDSEILYSESENEKDLKFYKFNILDFLPPLSS